MARVGVITFLGSLDDRDALRAVSTVGGTPVPLWHGDTDLQGVDTILLPGGFSYGDHLRCGALARFAPIMGAVAEFAAVPRELTLVLANAELRFLWLGLATAILIALVVTTRRRVQAEEGP